MIRAAILLLLIWGLVLALAAFATKAALCFPAAILLTFGFYLAARQNRIERDARS